MKAPDIVRDPEYQALKAHVLGLTGLSYYADKDADFALRIAGRLEARRAACGAYLRILREDTSRRELDALVGELTIGETYFFRQPEHFDALRETVFPDLLDRHRASRRLRIWSAGCATGAEPYSVAMLLQLEMAHAIKEWDISILGTDINRAFLDRARAGRFDDWTLRSSPPTLKERCFEREHRHWVLRPEFRHGTEFAHHNLATDPIPPIGVPPLDLILCRNVLIYFSRQGLRATVDRFYEALTPGGWLLVGHAEHDPEAFSSYNTIYRSGAVLYQKPAGPRAWSFRETEPVRLPELSPISVVAPSPLPDPKPAPAAVSDDDLRQIRALADRGRFEEAAAQCRQLLEADTLNAAAHFTYGLILEYTGPQDEAERYLRRAIYLDRGFALAHYHLGLCLQRKGAVHRARRSFDNASQILALRPADEAVEHGDGITVSELRDLAQMHLDLLEAK